MMATFKLPPILLKTVRFSHFFWFVGIDRKIASAYALS
jgi:hypothetical protein